MAQRIAITSAKIRDKVGVTQNILRILQVPIKYKHIIKAHRKSNPSIQINSNGRAIWMIVPVKWASMPSAMALSKALWGKGTRRRIRLTPRSSFPSQWLSTTILGTLRVFIVVLRVVAIKIRVKESPITLMSKTYLSLQKLEQSITPVFKVSWWIAHWSHACSQGLTSRCQSQARMAATLALPITRQAPSICHSLPLKQAMTTGAALLYNQCTSSINWPRQSRKRRTL